METASYFPGFEYSASEVVKFKASSDFFTILLKDGEIIHFSPQTYALFKQWLIDNNAKEIKNI